MKIKEIIGIFLLVVCSIVFISYNTYTKKQNQGYNLHSHAARGPFETDHPHIHDLIHHQNETIYALTSLLRSATSTNGGAGGIRGGAANSVQGEKMSDLVTAIRGASGQIEDDKSRTIAALDMEVTRLKQALAEQQQSPNVVSTAATVSSLQQEVVALKNQLAVARIHTSGSSSSGIASSSSDGGVGGDNNMLNFLHADEGHPADFVQSDLERSCSDRYGRGLLNKWKANRQEWCTSDSSTIPASASDSSTGTPSGIIPPGSLTCYPYHQVHKKLDGRPADLFCEGHNIVIDFSKVSGSISTQGKPPKGAQYLQFRPGNTLANCQKTKSFNEGLFMPHQRLQMGRGGFVTTAAGVHIDERVDRPTYLLARDEDCENTFHSSADFMNLYFVMSVLGLAAGSDQSSTIEGKLVQQVLLWDKFSDGPYAELIEKAFSSSSSSGNSGNNPAGKKLLRHTSFGSKVVLFKHVVWHLESPAGLIFPRVANPDPMRCHSAGLFVAYRKYVLNAFGLYNQLPPTVPSITISLRRRTAAKNVGRVMGNEAAVEAVLKEGNMLSYQMVDFSGLNFGEQLKIIRSTNILVGIHGVSV